MKWSVVSQLMEKNGMLGRTGKQCRERLEKIYVDGIINSTPKSTIDHGQSSKSRHSFVITMHSVINGLE
jgi:hypothetical protein